MHSNSNKLIFVCKNEPYFPSFSPEEYIEYSQISSILSQATKIFLRKPQNTPTTILSQFFQQYIKGQHVLLKAFANFQKSSFSRLCFVCNFSKIFEIQEENNDKNGLDYIQLVRLVCSDFPRQIIINALRLASGNYQLSEEIIMDKIITGKQFTKGLFISCMYTDLIKDLQSMKVIKLSDLLEYIRSSYKKKRMQFQKPSYKVMMDALLRMTANTSKEIVFVTETTIDSYIPTDTTTCYKFLNTLYNSDLNDREIQERLQFFDVLNLRVTEISKMLSEKNQSVPQYKPKKKKK